MRLSSKHRRRLTDLMTWVAGKVSCAKHWPDTAQFESWTDGRAISDGGALVHAVAAALPWAQLWRQEGKSTVVEYLLETSSAGVAGAIRIAVDLAGETHDDLTDCRHSYLFQELLAVARSSDRRLRGVYYTPPEIVRWIVESVDHALREQLERPEGLASPTVRVLDPATGSGVFPIGVLEAIHRRTPDRHDWNAMVPQVLARLVGWEIMPAAVVSAHCTIAAALAATGYKFQHPQPLRIELRDALAPPESGLPFRVVLGNPPYASLSTAKHGWIESLIRSPEGGYMAVDGRPLGEKKHWLHDDYVKFLRLAQWHVEQTGWGVVGMVTNHGYLQNASFRGMRRSLLDTFSSIRVVDLHGNAKRREQSPDGSRDENVFGITSGAAIGIFARPETPMDQVLSHAELWGSRDSKLADLEGGRLNFRQLNPTGPKRLFIPVDGEKSPAAMEYERGWRLCDAMPVNATAPVTARDRFVIAFSRDELVKRMEAFRDLSLEDEGIRRLYFSRTRSPKYPTGDSRGWKLADARRRLAADPSWRERIVLCQYRPLDYRWILWHDALIDWPRHEVTRPLLCGENLAIITRRQSPRGLPANYFWATQTIALDGIVRSDNCGSESLFPVWTFDGVGNKRANFAPRFLDDMQRAAGQPSISPEALAGYIYGLFWSERYRRDHQAELTSDFPRILLPRDAEEFERVSTLGEQLLRLHAAPPALEEMSCSGDGRRVAPGYPRWRDGRVWINSHTSLAEIDEAAWNLRVGTHQVARKWLKDRPTVAGYKEVVTTIQRTVAIQSVG